MSAYTVAGAWDDYHDSVYGHRPDSDQKRHLKTSFYAGMSALMSHLAEDRPGTTVASELADIKRIEQEIDDYFRALGGKIQS